MSPGFSSNTLKRVGISKYEISKRMRSLWKKMKVGTYYTPISEQYNLTKPLLEMIWQKNRVMYIYMYSEKKWMWKSEDLTNPQQTESMLWYELRKKIHNKEIDKPPVSAHVRDSIE